MAAITLDQFYHKFASHPQDTCDLPSADRRLRGRRAQAPAEGWAISSPRAARSPRSPKDAPAFCPGRSSCAGASTTAGDLPGPRKADDPAVILYSGGTTGVTKGILLSNLNFNALARPDHRHQPHASGPATRCWPSCPCSTASAWACPSIPCWPTAATASWCPASRRRAMPSCINKHKPNSHRRRAHPVSRRCCGVNGDGEART